MSDDMKMQALKEKAKDMRMALKNYRLFRKVLRQYRDLIRKLPDWVDVSPYHGRLNLHVEFVPRRIEKLARLLGPMRCTNKWADGANTLTKSFYPVGDKSLTVFVFGIPFKNGVGPCRIVEVVMKSIERKEYNLVCPK